MRIAVYGAGASGGHLAVRLVGAGHEVSVLARGAHLDAIRRTGLRLISGEGDTTVTVTSSDDPRRLGQQDLVLVTVKATALPAVAEGIGPLIGPDTRVIFCQNGLQWWYPMGGQQPSLPDLPVFRLAERFLACMAPEQVLGGFLYTANAVQAPGVVFNTSPGNNRIRFAPALPGLADDTAPLRAVFEAVGIASEPVDDVRRQLWRKLLFNMSGSLLALATLNKSNISRQDPELSETFCRLADEGLAIAAAFGHPLHDELVPQRMQAMLNDHKPSLLQDYEQGRRMELAEIALAPLQMARAAGVATPTLQTVTAMVCQLARDRGLL